MKTVNYIFQTHEKLLEFMQENSFHTHKNILVQVFTGECEKNHIAALIKTITSHLPHVKLLGSTTDGEIIQGKITEFKTIISFSSFESTHIETYITDFVEDSFQTGIALVEQMQNLVQARLLITFSQGLSINGEEYVKAIQSLAPTLEIAGGLASDNANFIATYVFTEKGIVKDGAVGALFFGEALFINRHYNFSWEPIGTNHTITKSEKNRVYTIDDIPAAEVYNKYLGHRIGDMLPATGIEFPLIIEKKNLIVARAVLNRHEDDSLSFAGNIAQNETVRFAYGNIESILEYAPVCSTRVSQSPVESIFIYSCMARKRLLGKDIEVELFPLSELAPTVGFFTNGEFFHNSGHENELLNQTMTIVALSESPYVKPGVLACEKEPSQSDSLTVAALSHLISVTSNELQELNEDLEYRVQKKTEQLRNLNASLEQRIKESKNELEEKYEELHETQKQLIENEKFASLGTLVAGVAHEINTPVGLSLTGITYLKSELSSLKKSYENESMTESDFSTFLSDSATMMQSIHTNLDKAAHLVKSFKQVAVDQSSDEIREFNLLEYVGEVLLSLHNITRVTSHQINIDIDKNIVIRTQAGAISQIITNLVVNSIIHAFDAESRDGLISISAQKREHELILIFSDNGMGMSEEVKRQLFDPFFTTKRGSGGSGLGMNIIYNLITHTLHGHIDVQSEVGEGTLYRITLPLNYEGV